MPNRTTTEVEALRARLEVAEETLAAISAGTVDALVVDGREGRRVYTLDGADQVYRELVERIEQGACALTPAGVVLFCNGAMARLVGRPLRSVTGHPLRELVAAESRHRLAALIAEARAGRAVRGDLVLESPAAGAVPVEIALSPFLAFGETALAGVLSDLREHRRREAELEARVAERTLALRDALARATTAEREVSEREERLRLATEAAHIGTWFLDVPAGKLSFSDRCRELYGLSPGDPVTIESVLGTVHPEDRALARDAVSKALVEGDVVSEYRVVRPDGSIRWLSVISRTFSPGVGGAAWNVGVVRDVTAQREHERQLASFQDVLEARVRERTAEVTRLADQLRVLAAELSHTEQRERRRLVEDPARPCAAAPGRGPHAGRARAACRRPRPAGHAAPGSRVHPAGGDRRIPFAGERAQPAGPARGRTGQAG